MSLYEADLSAFADDWKLADQADRTILEYLSCLRAYEKWCTEHELQTLTMRSAKSYLVEVRSRSTWKAYMVSRAIKAFGKWYAKEYTTDDPFKALDFVEQPKPKPQRTTTLADVAALLAVCGDDLRGLRDRALILVLASSGMRRTEVASMMRGHIDLASGIVTVPMTNNGQPRIVRLDKDAQRAVRRYWHALDAWELNTRRDPSDYVWVSTSRRSNLTSNGIGQMLHDRSEEAGVDVSAHAFRRGFAVQWLRKGGSSRTCARSPDGSRLGWSLPTWPRSLRRKRSSSTERIFG